MSQISLNEIIAHGMANYKWQGFDHAANCVLLLKAVDMGQNIRPGSRFWMTENLCFSLFIFLLQQGGIWVFSGIWTRMISTLLNSCVSVLV